MRQSVTIPARRGFAWVFAGIGVCLLAIVALFHDRLGVVGSVVIGLFGGVFAFGGLRQIIKPLPFAILTETGIAFPYLQIPEIHWSRILDVQVGPKSIKRGNSTTILWQLPLVLRETADSAELRDTLVKYRRTLQGRPDGTIDELIDTGACALSTDALIAEIGKWRPALSARRLGEATNAFVTPPQRQSSSRPGAAIMMAIAVALLLFGVFLGQQNYRAHSWPTTRGEVVSSTVTRTSGSKGPNYSPTIVYRYHVDGNDYTSRRFAFSYAGGQERSQAVVDRYPPGATVTVHYDPAKPESAILEHSSFYFSFGLSSAGVALLALGVFIWRRFPPSFRDAKT